MQVVLYNNQIQKLKEKNPDDNNNSSSNTINVIKNKNNKKSKDDWDKITPNCQRDMHLY